MEPPSESLKPKFSESETIQILKDRYRIRALKLKPLNGYDDENFHAVVDSTHENPYIQHIPTEGYFIKISNIIESNQPGILRAQLDEMKHLTEHGIPCQICVKNIDGDELTDCAFKEDDGSETVYKMSVREFIPGNILDSITVIPRYLYDIGLFVARLTQSLQDFYNPDYETFDPRWSLNNVPEVGKITHVIKDETRRRICEEVLKAFDEEVVPAKPGFRKGQVHGDLNEQNILVSVNAEKNKEKLDICGLLDFQDSCRSYFIYDLAMCTCYMMMTQKLDCPRLDVPGHLLAGYTTLIKLTEAEEKVFRILVAARMVQSLVYGMYTHYLDPSNVYALTTGTAGWGALVKLWTTPKDEIESRWREIIASYNP